MPSSTISSAPRPVPCWWTPRPTSATPELDLALLGYFDPVPGHVFDGYTELRPIDGGFPERRELWRLFAYLAVLAAASGTPLGRQFLARLDQAVTSYR